MVREKRYRNDANPWLVRAVGVLHYLLPVVLATILFVLYAGLYAGYSHPFLPFAETGILAYFVVEVSLEGVLYEDKKEFLKNHWYDIVLLIPALAVLRFAGRIGIALRSVRAVEALPYLRNLGHFLVNFLKGLKYAKVALVKTLSLPGVIAYLRRSGEDEMRVTERSRDDTEDRAQ